jgi:hypothetical protein
MELFAADAAQAGGCVMSERGHHVLEAIGITIGGASEAVAVERKRHEESLEAAIEAERKRKFTQTDVTRVVKGVQVTGAQVGKVEVTREKITVEVGNGEQPEGVLTLAGWRGRRHAR